MLGLALVAKEFILITVSAKWLESVPLLQLLCIYGAFYPVTMLYSYMAISRGKSGINLFCTITLCILIWVGLLLMYPYGVYSMVVYFVAINVAWLFVWQWFAWRMVRLSLWSALADILPFFLLAAGVMAFTWYITMPIQNIFLALGVKIALAFSLYTGLSYLSGAQIMRETLDYIKHLHRKS
jgi:O-antigen/teichoic acid export membrane protein